MALNHFPPSGGTLSSYLVGTWNSVTDATTSFLLVNPTSQDLWFRAVFFDATGTALSPCVHKQVPANGTYRIEVPAFNYTGVGAVKIVSFTKMDKEEVTSGLVGYKILRKWKWIFSMFGLFTPRYQETITVSESPLFQIPFEVLTDDSNKELNKIMTACP